MKPNEYRWYEGRIKTLLNQFSKGYINHHVILKRGEYKGRRALVTDIMLDHDGKLLALAYVLKKYPNGKDSAAWLNSKPDTRRYWPIDQLDWDKSKKLILGIDYTL